MIQLISIGNELCDGRTVNTNQHYIAQTLYHHGFYLSSAITTDDRLDLLVSTLKQSLTSHSVIITTGGLGPTEDDRTTHAIATLI